jgi:threonine dehydrogenase-like Zn-dependent dehydrogenase
MKAIVFRGIGDISLDNVPDPKIQHPLDAIVRITASAICGTDLHMIRGTMPGMKPGTILGHEGVGVIEELGPGVRNFRKGDRVVIPSTVGCGYCSYCRTGYFSQCDHANPNGPHAGTCFFGGPASSGPLHGMQAEFVRVPFANIGLVKVPFEVSDNQAILLSDIFPTGYFAATLAEIACGNTVAVFGCGPVGQFAITSAFLLGAGRVIAVDNIPSRLDRARALGAEAVNFDAEDPIAVIKELTGGIGVDRAIDAVGVDAVKPSKGPAAKTASQHKDDFERELQMIAPKKNPSGDNWNPGDGPSQGLRWAVEALAKAGTLSIVGVYPQLAQTFPIGIAMGKNLTVKMGNCDHRRYIPELLELVEGGAVHPEEVLSKTEPLELGIEAYKHFDKRESGWSKIELIPSFHESLNT